MLWKSDKRSEETNASWTKEHMSSNVFGCPDLWFQTHKGGSMSITMCIIETCRGEQVSDREGSHLQCRFSLEQTWSSLCCNSPTGFHKERCGQKLWMMVSNITRSRDRRASCYLKSISRLWRKNFRLRLICWIILVSGRNFVIVTSEQKSTPIHVQEHEIDYIFDELRIWDIHAGKFVLSLFSFTW